MASQKIVACLAMMAVSIAACSSPPSTPAPSGNGESKVEAMEVVKAIIKGGYAAPNPRDTTAQDCPEIGCDQSVVTDTITARSFGTSGRAEIYAKPLGLDQVMNLVVSFAPNVSGVDQSRYWTEVQKLVV